MGELKIECLEVTPFMQNCRILWEQGNKSAVVVDPGGESERILGFMKRANLKCEQVWLTHSHLDHCGGVSKIVSATGAMLLGHKREKDFRKNVESISSMYGVPAGHFENSPEPTRYIDEKDLLSVGEYSFRVIFTPGHSPGHLCFYEETNEVLLAGDTIFKGSIGRTDLPGCNHEDLMKSIFEKLFLLPDSTKVLSGHGPDTTLAKEKATNPFLQ